MTAITRTVNEIIEGAFKLIGIYSEDRDLEDFRTTEALNLLRKTLDHFGGVDTRIAYDSQLTFNLVINQREYTFSRNPTDDVLSNKIVDLKFVTIEDLNISFPVNIENDDVFFENRRNLLLGGRPKQCYFQNSIDETNSYDVSKIIFFRLPDKAYQCTIKAKFGLNIVSLSQPLSEVPSYYHLFLEYLLGRELRNYYQGSNWDNEKELRYKELLQNVLSANDLDLTSKTSASLIKPRYNFYEDFASA